MRVGGYPVVLGIVERPVQTRQAVVQQVVAELRRFMQVPRRVLAAPRAVMAAPEAPIHQPNPNDRVTLSMLALLSSMGWYDNR